LYENEGNDHNWVTLELIGQTANRTAVGTKVTLFVGKQQIHRVVNTGGSFGNNSLQLEIGIGTANKIDSVIVDWAVRPRKVARFYDLEGNRRYVIREGEELVSDN